MTDPRDLGPPNRMLPAASSASPTHRQLQLERELWRRRCRSELLPCAIEVLSAAHQHPAQHHKRIIKEIEAIARGAKHRLILIAPRGSGKSRYVSHISPAWLFAAYPGCNIIAVSHTSELAEVNSAFVQRVVREHTQTLGYDLASDARGRWRTTNGGEYFAAGVGQSVRGFRADYILADDLIRSYAEAESETSRNSLWEFFHADLLPCLKPNGGVILIATAYHEADLMCRLEKEQSDLWQVLRFTAIAEQDDILGRKEGEPLWPDSDYGYGDELLRKQIEYREHGRSRDWASQFQGRPRAAEGNMFKVAHMPILDDLPTGARIINTARAWDLAASSGRGDWTVGVKIVRLHGDPRYHDMSVITDVQRVRGSPDEVRHLVKTVAAADGRAVKIWLPQDPAQAGVDQAESYIQMLHGYRVAAVRQSGSKTIRADACASQANIGRVGLLKAPWNLPLLDELAAFPSGQHDDIVDALSLAFNQTSIGVSDMARWLALAS